MTDIAKITEPTGFAPMDAMVTLYGNLTVRIAEAADCGYHDPIAERALMAVANLHKPEITHVAMGSARHGKPPYPSWKPTCDSCRNQPWPCRTVRQMCHALGVPVPDVLR